MLDCGVVAASARLTNARRLLTLQAGVVGRRYVGRLTRIGESVHPDDRRFAPLDAELKIVGAARDLFLKESGGDGSCRAPHFVDAAQQRHGALLELTR